MNPEDLQKNSSGQIEEANRAYDTSTFSGLGYRILRKNIQSNKNILTQSMINMPNTIYEIRYDFDLNGATINLPANSVLQFVGGSIKNGTINFSNTLLSGDVKIKTNISGNIRNGDIYPEWFGAVGDGIIDDSNAFLTAFELISNSFISIDKFRRVGYTNTLVLDTNKKYYITSSLELNFASINIKGAGTLIYGGKNHCIKFTKCTGVNIDISFIAKSDFADTYKVDWNDNPNRTAIILDGVRESNFKFDKIVGFTKGIVVTGDGNYGCYNNYFKLASMYNLYKSIVIESFNQYWPNDNVVEGGYFIGNIDEVANTIINSPTAIRSFIEINGDSIYPITSWKFKDCYFQGQLAVLTNGDNIVTKVFYANQYCKNFKFENIAIEDTTSSTGSVFHFNNDQCKDIEIDTIDYVDNYNFNYLGFISNDWNYLKRLHNITFKQREGLQEIYRINVSKYYEVPFRVESSTNDDGGILLSNDLNPIFDLKNSKFVNRYNPNKSFPISGNLLSVTKGQIYYYDLKPAGNIRIIFMKSDYSVLTSNEYNSQTDIDIFSNIGITLSTYQDKSYYITGSTNGTNLTINMLNNTLIKYIYVCSSNSTKLIISQNKYSTAVKNFIFENNQYRNGGFIINQNINSAMLTALTGDRIYNLYDNKEYRIINSGTKGLDLSDITVTAIKGDSYITVTGNISRFKIGNIIIIDNYQYTIRSISGQSLYVTPSIQSSVTNTTVSFKKLIFEDSDKNVDGTLLSKEVIVRSIDEITLPNIIYKIVSDIDLNNTTLTLPANCTLDFQGGSFTNGTIVFQNTSIKGDAKLFVSASGTIANTSISLNWFGLSPDADDNSVLFSRIQNLNCSYRELTLEHGNYNFSQTIVFEQSNVTFRGISGRTFGGSDVTLVITVDDVLLRLKGTRYQIKDITFAGSVDARTASVGLMFSRVDNPDSTTESALASIDSKVENCQFYNLWRGIYVLGNQIRLSDLSFSRCMQGMAFDTFAGASPMYYGSNGRSYVISRCNFHSMVSTDLANGCIVILNRDCICFQISGCHQDCETHFIVGQALTRSTIEDNMIANVTQGGIRVSRIYNSIITGNSFLSSLGTNNPVINDSPSNRLRQGIYATVDAFSSIISNNYFDYCNMEHIRLEKSLNITITGNTFRRWGQSITEANKCALWLPGNTTRVTVTANTFEQDIQANSYLAYIQDGSKSVFADNIINTKNGAKIVRYTVGETVQACFNIDNNVTSDIIVPTSDNISSIDSVTNKEGFFYVYNNSGGGLPLGIISADITVRRITIDKLLKVLIPFDLSYGVWTQVVDLTNSTITKWTPMNKALTRPVSNYSNFDSTDTGALHWDGTSLKLWNGTSWTNV